VPISEYRYPRRVQFSETDAARIVHFSRFFVYMDEAEHALWREAGLSIAPRGATFGFARVGASFDFHLPLRFEDECIVHIRIARITARSIRYTCVVTRGEERIATGAMTVVCVTGGDSDTMRSMPIPPEIAERFEVAADA
jgi:YbgC/YbaW family acyl-CoA thioester hydrolase